MLSLLFCKAINAVFSRVFIPVIIILSMAVSVFIFNTYISFLFPIIGPYCYLRLY